MGDICRETDTDRQIGNQNLRDSQSSRHIHFVETLYRTFKTSSKSKFM